MGFGVSGLGFGVYIFGSASSAPGSDAVLPGFPAESFIGFQCLGSESLGLRSGRVGWRFLILGELGH